MSAARALALLLGLPMLLALAFAMAGSVWVISAFPPSQDLRVRGPHELVGVLSVGLFAERSYAWVIPSETGVVVVDAGVEARGTALLKEIGKRPVRAVLLTHAHAGHALGLAALPPDVPVYAAQEELDVLAGRRVFGSPVARALYSATMPREPRSGKWVPVKDGEELVIDGLRIAAHRVPGHTAGHTVYLWEDVLFSGDAVLGGPGLAAAPDVLADDPALARKSLERVVPLDFDAVADGHVGLTTTARPALLRMAGVAPTTAPTVSVRTANVALVREGVYVQWPALDVRGEQPALVVFPDGTSWRLAAAPIPEHAALVGLQVKVVARTVEGGVAVLEEIAAVPGQAASRPLIERVGEIIPVDGELRAFAPLSQGARWGEGEIVLADGTVARVSAPMALAAEGRLIGFAQVVRDGERVGLVAIEPVEPVEPVEPAPEAP